MNWTTLKRRTHRITLAATFVGASVVVVLSIVHWDHVQAWHFLLTKQTETIVPDPALTGTTVESSFRVAPTLHRYLYRFKAKTLLRFLASRSGQPVITDIAEHDRLEFWLETDTCQSKTGMTAPHVLFLLRSKGWRIVEQTFPRRAYVVLPNDHEPQSTSPRAGQAVLVFYEVSDILKEILDFEGPEISLQPARNTKQDPSPLTAESAAVEAILDSAETLKTLMQESTGGSEAWSEPNAIEFHAGRFLVRASPGLHAEFQQVLDRLRRDP